MYQLFQSISVLVEPIWLCSILGSLFLGIILVQKKQLERYRSRSKTLYQEVVMRERKERRHISNNSLSNIITTERTVDYYERKFSLALLGNDLKILDEIHEESLKESFGISFLFYMKKHSLLFYSANPHHFYVLFWFLKRFGKPNETAKLATGLLRSHILNFSCSEIEYLIALGADPGRSDISHTSPTSMTFSLGSFDKLEALVRAGANMHSILKNHSIVRHIPTDDGIFRDEVAITMDQAVVGKTVAQAIEILGLIQLYHLVDSKKSTVMN